MADTPLSPPPPPGGAPEMRARWGQHQRCEGFGCDHPYHLLVQLDGTTAELIAARQEAAALRAQLAAQAPVIAAARAVAAWCPSHPIRGTDARECCTCGEDTPTHAPDCEWAALAAAVRELEGPA